MKTIIKGAIYYTGYNLLRPHFTGEFFAVDCTEYKTKKQIKQDYDKEYAKSLLENPCLTFNSENYYECGYSPYETKNFELLSDISNIEFYDEETEF